MQAKKSNFIKQLLAVIILAIFSLAITPWSILHHHEEVVVAHEKNCTHNVHVKTSEEHCLVCKVHFEKNYSTDLYTYLLHLPQELIKRIFPLLDSSFTEVIATSLRGPPSFS